MWTVDKCSKVELMKIALFHIISSANKKLLSNTFGEQSEEKDDLKLSNYSSHYWGTRRYSKDEKCDCLYEDVGVYL